MSTSRNVGSDNGRAKLNEKSVQEIRILFSSGKCTTDLAKMYGVHRSTIWYVVQIRTWKHV